jgi:hypothetical protein
VDVGWLMFSRRGVYVDAERTFLMYLDHVGR